MADEHDDLAGIDLGQLELDDIDVPEETSGRTFLRFLWFSVLASAGVFVLWLPGSEWYRRQGENNALFFVICGAGLIIGVTLARSLWNWAQEAAARYAAEAEYEEQAPEKEDEPPSALRRWLTLLVVVGGACAILFGIPAGAYYQQGEQYHTGWFLGAGGAIVVGILLGRWLLMQATAAAAKDKEDTAPREPIKFPPWFKWVTLGALVALGLFTVVGPLIFGSNDASFEFGLGAIGFVVGVFGAIWIARRFDELEQKATSKKAPPAGQKGA